MVYEGTTLVIKNTLYFENAVTKLSKKMSGMLYKIRAGLYP